jgi:hypothetical protein
LGKKEITQMTEKGATKKKVKAKRNYYFFFLFFALFLVDSGFPTLLSIFVFFVLVTGDGFLAQTFIMGWISKASLITV